MNAQATKTTKSRLYSFFRAALFSKYGRCPVDYTTQVETHKSIGRSFHYTTLTGKPIYHPAAYRWPKCYHPSTLEIQLNPYWLCKFLAAPRGYQWSLDELGICLVQLRSGETFHPTRDQMLLGAKAIAKLLRQAVITRKRTAKINARISKLASTTWVTLEDSVKSGNCEHGSKSFAQQHRLGDCGAVRADYLLSLEDSNRTRNAVRIAIAKRS